MKTVTRTRTASADITAREVELFRKYLTDHPDVGRSHEQAYGEQGYRIATLANIFSVEVAWHAHPDPDRGTAAQRLASVKLAQEEFQRARDEIRELFGAWLNERDLPTREKR